MNLRLRSSDVRFILFIVAILLFTFSKSFAANITSAGSGNWNSTSTWTGGVIPGINDDVTIVENHAITVNANTSCNSVVIGSGSNTSTNITISSGFSLTITNALTMNTVSSANTKTIAVGDATLTCGSLNLANNTSNGISRVRISTGTFIVNGNITMSGSTSENFIVFTGAGRLLISGNWTGGSLTGATNCKVVYRGNSAQSVRAVSYRKLQFYGAGTKTLAGNIIVGNNSGDSLDVREGTNLNVAGRVISAGTTGIVFQISGNINTTNTNGLTGSTSTSLSNANSPTINIEHNSTIEYNSTSSLAVSALNYGNLILTGNSNKTISAETTVSNELDVNAGTLITGGFLTLTSTANTTARVGTLNGSITGDVTVQRFIPGGSNKRKWRFLSSPVNVSGTIAISQLKDNILITAPAGAAAGFDVNSINPNNTASLRTYDESVGGISNNGWTDPSNISNTISSGIGMEVFVRGTRGLNNPYDPNTSPDDVTIDYTGALNTGNISPAITYTPSAGGATTADGFNLVGNPYASTIDFTNAGLTLTNVDDKFWCYNPNTGSYGIYDNSLGDSTNGITRYIASGQAFFIRANGASPAITFTEAMKVAANGNNYFRNAQSQSTYPIMHIVLSNDSANSDEALIVLDETASCNSGDSHDAGKLFNDALNVYTVSDDKSNLTINALPFLNTIDTIKLSVFSYNGNNIMTTSHHLRFTGMSSFTNTQYIYLKDEYTNTISDLKLNEVYNFNITTDPGTYGNSRFKLLFSNKTLGINNADIGSIITVFPNPATNTLYIGNTNNANVEVEVIDIFGRTMISKKSLVNRSIDISSIPSGNYFIKINDGENLITRRFIKE